MVFFIDEARSRPPPPPLLTNVNNKMDIFLRLPLPHYSYEDRHRDTLPILDIQNCQLSYNPSLENTIVVVYLENLKVL